MSAGGTSSGPRGGDPGHEHGSAEAPAVGEMSAGGSRREPRGGDPGHEQQTENEPQRPRRQHAGGVPAVGRRGGGQRGGSQSRRGSERRGGRNLGRGLVDAPRSWLRSDSASRAGDPINPRVEKHLLRSERVLVQTRRHAVVALVPMTLALAVLVVVAALTARISADSPLVDLLWWLALGVIGWAGYHFIEWRSQLFVATDRRVMLFTGFITRRVGMMPLVKVTDMTYQRTPAGRLLRYGDFIMESAGQDQALHRVTYLPRPQELYQRVSAILFGRTGDSEYDTRVDLARIEE